MADIREQLLRAGIIDKQTKQQADTSARRGRRRKKRKKRAAQTDETRRQTEYQSRIAAEAAENRLREDARRRAQEAQDLQNQVANLADAWALREPKPGPRRFCFVSRERRILRLDVSEPLGLKLELGQLAIVEQPGNADEPHAIVPREIARRIHALDPEAVRFWNRD